jgi:membrane protease YdiL (CAAX protease family)
MNKHPEYKQSILLIAGISTILAGAIHATLVASTHVAPLPIETIFFVFAGLLQIVIAKSVIRTGRLKHAAALFSIINVYIAVYE